MTHNEILDLLQANNLDWMWYNPFGIPSDPEAAQAEEERKRFTARRVQARWARLSAAERDEVRRFLQNPMEGVPGLCHTFPEQP